MKTISSLSTTLFQLIKKNKATLPLLCSSLLITPFSQATITTSIKPLGFIASAIADQVDDVSVIIPDGGSPHSYALKPSDLLKVKDSDLVIWIGPEMEAFMPNLLAKTENKQVITLAEVPAIKALLQKGEDDDHDHEDEHDHDHDHDAHSAHHDDHTAHNHEHDHDHAAHHDEGHEGHHHGEYDMHLWLSPKIAEQTAIAIYEELLAIHPDKKEILAQNLAVFQKELNSATETIAIELNNMDNKGYFVFHNAYGYFEESFKLNNLGSITLNPAVQPGVKTVVDIQTRLKNAEAVCVFSEPQFDMRMVTKIVDGTEVKVAELDPLGVDIAVGPKAYTQFINRLANQFKKCLE